MKIYNLVDEISKRELSQMVDRFYNLCKADNEELLKQWLNNRNWLSFDSMGFEVGNKQFMNIKAKVQKAITFTYPKQGAKDCRITGTTAIGFNPDGTRGFAKGYTENEVIEKIARKYTAIKKQDKAVYINDIIDNVLIWKRGRTGDAESTIKIDRQNYENFIKDSKLEKTPIETIDFVALEDFVIEELIPRYEAKNNRKLTAKGLRNKLTVLKAVFDYSVHERIVKHNPFNDGTMKLGKLLAKPKIKKDQDMLFSEQEMERIVNHCINTYKTSRYHNTANLAVVFLLYTGCRVGEASAIKWADLSLTTNPAYVDIQRAENNAKEITEVKCDSEAGRRRICLPPELVNVLKMIRKDSTVLSEWVFARQDGSRVDKKAIHAALTNAEEQEGLKAKGTHTFRRTYCSTLLDNGVTHKEAQKLMGHKDQTTTLMYYAYNTKSFEDTAQRVNGILGGNIALSTTVNELIKQNKTG